MILIIVAFAVINTVKSSIASRKSQVVLKVLSGAFAACPKPVVATGSTSVIIFSIGIVERDLGLFLLGVLLLIFGRWVPVMIFLLDLLFCSFIKCCLIKD